MENFLWFIYGNISGSIVMTAIWCIIGTHAKNKNKGDNK
jgi:hypothetical protein